jgi:DNA-binding CsgD family transcriptional regulator/PAS domain-containing protein
MSQNDRRSSFTRVNARQPVTTPVRNGKPLPRRAAPPRATDAGCRGAVDRAGLGAEQLSALIGEVYEAALDPTLWPSVLATTTQFVEASVAGLHDETSKPRVNGRDDVGPSAERDSSELLQRDRLVAKHLNRAGSIEREYAKAAALVDLFDHFRSGMILLTSTGNILHANAAGRRILALGSVLRAASGRLAASETHGARAFQDHIEAAIAEPGPNPRGCAFTLRGRDDQRYVGQVLPLSAAARRREVAAIVLISKVAFAPASIAPAIAEMFDLTPTELRVLLACIEWNGVTEAATALGVGRATVKTHLHRLFRKTGTSCQAELVKLVAAFSSTLVG